VDKAVQIGIFQYRKHQKNDDYIARANTESKRIGLFETVLNTSTNLREKCRSETEKQRQSNAAYYA
jgi:hypothetical protein